MLKRLRHKPKSFKRRWAIGSVLFAVFVGLLSFLFSLLLSLQVAAQTPATRSPAQTPTPDQIDRLLPQLQTHPLPNFMSRWQPSAQQTDYFDQVQPTIAGYLVWSRFPVRVYLEPAPPTGNPAETAGDRAQAWVTAVTAAIQDWNTYLPLAIVNSPDTADITIWRRTPPLRTDQNGTRELRARSAETRFTFRVDQQVDLQVDQTKTANPVLSHRMTIWLGTNQTQTYLRAAARHELGHALGIWGHSPTETDVMYFAQVRQPPPISDRDLNTLKRIYRQPTRLGWAIPQTPAAPNAEFRS